MMRSRGLPQGADDSVRPTECTIFSLIHGTFETFSEQTECYTDLQLLAGRSKALPQLHTISIRKL